jgi:endonuclease/exonuclease/phosphatase family metal-dependent hydrolase
VIRESEAELIGLQEVRQNLVTGQNQLQQLAALLPEYNFHYQAAQVDSEIEEGHGIMSRCAREF